MNSSLQAQRAALDQQIAQEEREEARNLWEQAKGRARKAKEEVYKLRAAFKQSVAAWQAYELECAVVKQSLEAHVAARPSDDSFPTAAEVDAWEAERVRLHNLLTVDMRARRLELADTMERDRLAVLRANQELATLAYAERNARPRALGK